MARLHIYVDVRDGNTISKFGVPRNGQVVFLNQHATDSLHVVIEGASADSSPLCKGGQKIVSFDVAAGKKDGYKICSDFEGVAFKYSATVGNAATEDPIVIIETSGFSTTEALVGGAIIGFGLGLLAAVAFLRSKMQQAKIQQVKSQG